MPEELKSERIEARTSPSIQKLIEQAAKLDGRSISDYVISMASAAARKTIAEFNVIQLSIADQKAFAEKLLNPDQVAEPLQRAMKEHEQTVEQS